MKTEIRNDKTYFRYDCKEAQFPDMVALKMMERNDIEGLLPFKYVRQEDEKYFRYETGGGETLEQWLTRVQYRRDVMELLESLLRLEKEIETYLLRAGNLCMDTSAIIVNHNVCRAAYIPTIEEGQGNLLELTQNILSSVKYALDEDFSYLFELQNAFGRKDIRNREDLKKWLKIVKGEEKADIDGMNDGREAMLVSGYADGDREAMLGSGHADGGRKAAYQPLSDVPAVKAAPAASSVPSGIAADSLEGIFGNLGSSNAKKEKKEKKEQKHKKEDHSLGFLGKTKKKEKQDNGKMMDGMQERVQSAPNSMPQREIINNLERGDVTVMMDTAKEPMLINVETAMEYSLSKTSYTIGSGKQADIVVQNNKTVSRAHARIFQNGDFWYMEDLGSTNGTCVNGEMLRKMEPYKLEDGARIQLSNENYTFHGKDKTY